MFMFRGHFKNSLWLGLSGLRVLFTNPNVSDLGASFSAKTLCEILLEQTFRSPKFRIDTLIIFKIWAILIYELLLT